MGAFAIYLWVGVFELKDYPVLNKILVISLITYNVIFIAGLISFFIQNPIVLNTSFAFSFWIILGLGFLLFGRKYIVVWRFMSPSYLTLFLYILAWIAVVFVDQYTPLKFNQNTPLNFDELTLGNLIFNIYFVLILVNWLVYFSSGPILDKMLGIRRISNNDEILNTVNDVKNKLGIKGKVKTGFGKYPILNAMAYGPVFDKRIAIIASDLNEIPKAELEGIVAHELSHTKGNHTLILTVITSLDLVFRMILGLPATYYDYTFGEPRIPLLGFILLNVGIYAFLYIFVRLLEGNADLRSKKAGYGKELATALYNLESFYAVGREIGLNTMLLSDEKITRENQMLDYLETAQYINNSMIKPSKTSLLANFLNSHPPTFFRLVALLDDGLNPKKEAILPFLLLSKKEQEKYSRKFEIARNKFKEIANNKFKVFFDVQNIASLMQRLDKKTKYKLDLNQDFLFRNKMDKQIVIGKMIDVQFEDDITDPDKLIVKDINNGHISVLSSSLFTRTAIKLNQEYLLNNSKPLKLDRIDLNEERTNGFYVFTNQKNDEILKSIEKCKLPNPINFIEHLEGKMVFMKVKGMTKLFKCLNIKTDDTVKNYEIELSSGNNGEDKVNLRMSDLIIHPKNIHVSMRKRQEEKDSIIEILNWMIKAQIRATIFLKKPVNNIELGYIKKIEFEDKEEIDHNSKLIDNAEFILVLENIFGQIIQLPSKKVEAISFKEDTAFIQKKSDTSIFSKIGYLVLRKVRPKEII